MRCRAPIMRLSVSAAVVVLAACQPANKPAEATVEGSEAAVPATPAASEAGAAPGDTSETRAYLGITESETVRFTGTEPFWGGQVAGTTLTYSTPENQEGDPITVTRFAGRNGVSWSGTWQDKPFRLAVTEAKCSDGMSDRTYPFTATLEVLGEQRQGCAWTDRRAPSLPEGGAPAP